jgi:hypothetical protein
LTSEVVSEPIVLAIRIDDPILADRLTVVLSNVSGLRLARVNEVADVAVVSSQRAQQATDQDAPLTPREIQVLSLSLLDKFEAIGRTDAVAHALRLGVIEL